MNGQCQFYVSNDAAETHDSNPENYYLANSFVDNELPDNFCRALLPFEAIFSVNHADIVDIISFMFSRIVIFDIIQNCRILEITSQPLTVLRLSLGTPGRNCQTMVDQALGKCF